MIYLRKTKVTNRKNIYSENPVIRVSKSKFTVSKLITEQLKINVDTQALMFGLKDRKLHVIIENKESDNYHLGTGETHSYRFRSVELYEFIKNFYKIKDEKIFFLELQEDNTFRKL